MADREYTREYSIEIIKRRSEELRAQGVSGYPRRSDFSEREVVAIKAFLGPWPRALEIAGVKPPRSDAHDQKTREKRIRARRRRNLSRKDSNNTTGEH